eukprot:5283415-Karenia_brevis.AAC.1
MGHLGSKLGSLRTISFPKGPSWASWPVLGAMLGHIGACWIYVEASWRYLEASGGRSKLTGFELIFGP